MFKNTKVLLVENLSNSTIKRRGFKVDNESGRSYLYTNIKTGKQSISLGDLLKENEFFIPIHSKENKERNFFAFYFENNLLYFNYFSCNYGASSVVEVWNRDFKINSYGELDICNKEESVQKLLPKGSRGYSFIPIEQYSSDKYSEEYIYINHQDNYELKNIFDAYVLNGFRNLYDTNKVSYKTITQNINLKDSIITLSNSANNLQYYTLEYLNYKEPSATKKNRKIVNSINNQIDDLDDERLKEEVDKYFNTKEDIFEYSNMLEFGYIESCDLTINSKTYESNIIRCINYLRTYDNKFIEAKEVFRVVYIYNKDSSKSKILFLRKNNYGEWIDTNMRYSLGTWSHDILIDKRKLNLVGELKYISSLLALLDQEIVPLREVLMIFKNQGVFEKIWKYNSKTIENLLYYNIKYPQYNSWFEQLASEHVLFNIDDKDINNKSVYDILGFNKHQLSFIDKIQNDLKKDFPFLYKRQKLAFDFYFSNYIYKELKVLINGVLSFSNNPNNYTIVNDYDRIFVDYKEEVINNITGFKYDLRDIDLKTFQNITKAYLSFAFMVFDAIEKDIAINQLDSIYIKNAGINSIDLLNKDSIDRRKYESINNSKILDIFVHLSYSDIIFLLKDYNITKFATTYLRSYLSIYAKNIENKYFNLSYRAPSYYDYINYFVYKNNINSYIERIFNSKIDNKNDKEIFFSLDYLANKSKELQSTFYKLEDDYKNNLFIEAVEELKKYEFSNDLFSVIVPEAIEDIVNEGRSLKHCVGTYVDSIINKQTNILFIRKNNDLNKPYYTIEINDGKLLQVRGFANKDIENQDLHDFIKVWKSVKNIT